MTNKNGFTLIELMVVIVILGTLAAVAVPKLFGFSAKAKAAEISTAAGSYIHLQEAFLHTNHTAGTWAEIGYNAPGNGQSSSFVYKDCISSKTTIEKNGASITG